MSWSPRKEVVEGLAALALATTFTGIIVSPLLAFPRWSLLDNALSDLGNPALFTKSYLLFNICVVLGGVLLLAWSTLSARSSRREDPRFSSLIIVLLMSLVQVLVGAVNESYGLAHFAVSAVLFLLCAALVIYNLRQTGDPLLALGLVTAVVLWISHFTISVPRGAAIPELVSVVVTMYCFIRYVV